MITIERKIGKNLSKRYVNLMNKYRKKEFGPKEVMDLKKNEHNSTFFFVKEKKEIVAFGILKPICIDYLGKKYNILGFRSGIAIKKGKGYGKILMQARIKQCHKEGKTGLGFCLRRNLGFFEKCGLQVEKSFIKRFCYINPVTKKIKKDNIGDGLYYNGKDNFIKKVLSTKSLVYTNVPFW